MKLKIKYIILIFYLFFCNKNISQVNFNQSNSINVIENNSILENAWAGGLNFCQFSEVDLNLDGVNDLFKPIIKGYDYYELIITDRWGETVFRSLDVNETWDGYQDGEVSPIGVYKCEVIYSKLNDIMKLSHYVNVNLIR